MTAEEAAAYVVRWATPALPSQRTYLRISRERLLSRAQTLAKWREKRTGEAVEPDEFFLLLSNLEAALSAPRKAALSSDQPPLLPLQASAEPLGGGLVNDVWRVRLWRGEMPKRGTYVVKHASERVAGLPLDPARLGFEAAAIRLVRRRLVTLATGHFGWEGDGAFRAAAASVSVPWFRHYDADARVLIVDDLGDLPDLGAWLYARAPGRTRRQRQDFDLRAERRGRRIGRYISALHVRWHGDAGVAAMFDNRSVQETRLLVQYRAVGELLARAGVPDADALGAKAANLGERLLEPGRCLIHGDLWPRSLLCGPEYTRVIDWEFAHFGQPAQDTGHLAAHLWMLRHRAPTPEAARAVEAFASGFARAYEAATPPALRLPGDARDAALHAGCEILVRTVGAFQEGYVYDGLAPDAPAIREAVACAAAWMRSDDATLAGLFGAPF